MTVKSGMVKSIYFTFVADYIFYWRLYRYEYTPDRTLHKFMKRVAISPTQCVRYNHFLKKNSVQ